MLNAKITGIASYVPDYVLTNDELSQMVDTNDEWITTRVGIKERRILKGEGLGSSYMGKIAVDRLLASTGTKKEEVDLVICATSNPDYRFPSTASIIAHKCGLSNCYAYDIQAACAGFIVTLQAANAYIRSGLYKKVIVVAAEMMSSMTNYEDRTTCPLFGDAAAAVMVEPTEEEGIGVIDGVFHVNGDWFAKEMEQTMSDIISEEGGIDSFKTMRMPVVSALGVKLGIEDSTLSDIIDYLDGDTANLPDFESTAGYTDDAVVAAVREARTIVHSIGPNHTAVIPAYANGKDVAVDFLRFMATDIAQESYIRSTGGASLPFNYDLKEKNIELYNELHPLQQSRHDYFNAYEIYTLPSDRAFPLARYGGIKAFVTEHYYTTFSANGNQKTPGDYYDETISAWTTNKFNNALSNSGIVR